MHIRVFDAAGRLVHADEEERTAGSGSMTWNLHDDDGDRVPPGVYWARIDCAGFARAARFVVR